MTETKIQFKIKRIKKIPIYLIGNKKGLELDIETETCGADLVALETAQPNPIPDFTIDKMAFIFIDNTKDGDYDALLNGDDETFELKFDKDKVCFGSFDNTPPVIDPNKPRINVGPNIKQVVTYLDTRSNGIISLKKTKNSPLKELQEKLTSEVTKLKGQINVYLVVSIVLGITIIVGAIAFVYDLKKFKKNP